MVEKTTIRFLAMLLFTIISFSCTDSTSVTMSNGEVAKSEAENSGNEFEAPKDFYELSQVTGLRWLRDEKLYGNGLEADREGYGVGKLDLLMFNSLDEKELSKVKEVKFSGIELSNQEEFDFSIFTNLTHLRISDTELKYVNGIEALSITELGLTDVAISDISFISELTEAESIWIRTTEPIDQLPDLTKLENIYEFAIQANPLKTLDGIDRIPNSIRLVIGKVEDISALENIDPNKFFILMDERDQEAQPEIVQEIRDMGFEISADWGL